MLKFVSLDVQSQIREFEAPCIEDAVSSTLPMISKHAQRGRLEKIVQCNTCKSVIDPPDIEVKAPAWLMQWPVKISKDCAIYMAFSDGDNYQQLPIHISATRILIDKELLVRRMKSTNKGDVFRHCVRGDVVFFKVAGNTTPTKDRDPEPPRVVSYPIDEFVKDWEGFFMPIESSMYSKLYRVAYENGKSTSVPFNDLLKIEFGVDVTPIIALATGRPEQLATNTDRAFRWILAIVLHQLHPQLWNSCGALRNV